jgi:dTMP kinase
VKHPTQSPMPSADVYADRGVFVAFEGGEGAGKSTQARMLSEALHKEGYDVVLTHEPGGSPIGSRLREILLDRRTGEVDPRTEALLYAADKAEHVQTLVWPALRRGAVVITDRYVDSLLAYQAAGRALPAADVGRLAAWATGHLRPHLTVLLDLDPGSAANRVGVPDRLESEPVSFHERVRAAFLACAERHGDTYLVLAADLPRSEIANRVWLRVGQLLTSARAVSRGRA